MREAKSLRLMLEEMGHKQPATPVHCDNNTAVGIANDTVKKQQSRSMEMHFFGLQTNLNKTFSEYYGISELKMWLIILQSIFPPPTTAR